ncbi:MAG: histidine kinase [Flavisolibacter sp.]|nr:histidine kinase [Flavisolibacter sp.]
MRLYDFIFSNQRFHRLTRHCVFWTVFLLYFYYTNFFPGKPEDLSNARTYTDAFALMIFFPVSIFSVYATIYFLLPKYVLTSRHVALVLMTTVFILVNFSLAYLLTKLLAALTTTTPFHQLPLTFRWFLPIRYGIGLPLTSAAITAIIKLLKTWHLKQKENERLLQQKVKNEIQLLKTQFQPQFLYNTLREISLLVQKHSAQVPTSLMKLSELLSYLLYEIEKDEVPLEQEIQMVKNFISLKKTFHEKKLTLKFRQEGDMAHLPIAPLLLVSLVENFFVQWVDSTPEACTVTIDIKTDRNEVYVLLECKKENGIELTRQESNLWWKPSLKKIELLYPYRHRFEAYTENDTTSCTLMLETLSNPSKPETVKDKTAVHYEPA